MIVDEPHVLPLLEDLYQAFKDFALTVSEAVDHGARKQWYDIAQLNTAKSSIIKKRDPMVKATREYLARSRKLRAFRHQLPAEETPVTPADG